MNTVNAVCSYIHRALEAESHIRSPEVVVYGLGQSDDIESFLTEHIRCLVSSVTAQNNHAVQFQLIVILLHRLDLIKPVFIRLTHQLKRGSGAAENGAALRQNTRKIVPCQNSEIPINHTLIAIQKTINLHVLTAAGKALHHASHRGV